MRLKLVYFLMTFMVMTVYIFPVYTLKFPYYEINFIVFDIFVTDLNLNFRKSSELIIEK